MHIHTHIRTYTSTTYICTETTTKQYAHRTHTICTHTETETNKQNNMQHIEDNTEHSTEQNTENSTQPQHTCSTYDLHKYSFDFYHEYIAINNSNTIELYTISKD